ncbi:hypothetical protein AORI_3252 [Amycolatopsis keratiniphila]|uniref:Uncharacterized protein n=1 Tax=Amycolatopsis keratiniphila TaxID=129921 RepID=R4T489_9PSEU|nr:hypothetical protein AORI_3252 [Amycolatopsis keratiniphila]
MRRSLPIGAVCLEAVRAVSCRHEWAEGSLHRVRCGERSLRPGRTLPVIGVSGYRRGVSEDVTRVIRHVTRVTEGRTRVFRR